MKLKLIALSESGRVLREQDYAVKNSGSGRGMVVPGIDLDHFLKAARNFDQQNPEEDIHWGRYLVRKLSIKHIKENE